MDGSVVIGRQTNPHGMPVPTKLIDDGKILDNSMKQMLIHGIDATDVMTEPDALDKLNAHWDNLRHLMKMARTRADAWLQKNFRSPRAGIDRRHSRRVSLVEVPPWWPLERIPVPL